MTYADKLDHAHGVIMDGLAAYDSHVVASSFGKDSMVLVDLVRQHADLPVVFHREPFQPRKYQFAEGVIRDWNLRVHDFPPTSTACQEGNGEVEIVGYYQVGAAYNMLPTGIRAPKDGEDFVCGLRDIYQRPTGAFNWPWEALFHGHKASDHDPVWGDIPINADIHQNVGSASYVFPLRHWTDEDIWRYTEENGLPVHGTRYEKVDGRWREREDKALNQDYVTACTACMSRTAPASVPCPKLGGKMVSNVSGQLRWADKVILPYMQMAA